MKTLPTHSMWSLAGGLWFVFDVDGTPVRLWAASLSGRERLYVGDKVVSQARGYRKTSVHHFEIGGESYEVRLVLTTSPRRRVTCDLLRQGTRVQGFEVPTKKRRAMPAWRLVLRIVLCGAAAAILADLAVSGGYRAILHALAIAPATALVIYTIVVCVARVRVHEAVDEAQPNPPE